MQTQTVFETTIECNWAPANKQIQRTIKLDLPAVPVLPGTLLQLNLIVYERCVDLREISRIILSDLGATLQILRLAGAEYGAQACTTRIEDYISDLGLDACMQAISSKVIAGDRSREAITDLWIHSAQIAQYARLIAEETHSVHPDEAYLAGLLHALGSLPKILGWARLDPSLSDATGTNDTTRALRLASLWALPCCISRLLKDTSRGNTSALSDVIRRAHLRSVV